MRTLTFVFLLAALTVFGVTAVSSAQTPKPRVWADSSGNFKIIARFIRIDGADVLLRRDDNKKEIRVPLDRLSKSDLAFLRTKTDLPEPYAKSDPGKKVAETNKPSKPKQPDVRRKDALALAGFNNRKGLGSRRGRRGPYQLDALSPSAGQGERGWSGPWSATEKATAQSRSVFEGDGALHLEGTASVRRSFAEPLKGRVEIEQYVRVPTGGHVICYVWEKNHTSSGPMWTVKDGEFLVLDGDERGNGKWMPTGVTVTDTEWIKVVVEIDTEKRRWKLKLPAKNYISDELKYRGVPKQLLAIHFLAETRPGVYIDAIQLGPVKTK